MDTFNKLTDVFRSFPGIGPRQAKRFVYFLLSREPEFADKLSELARALKKEIIQCKECFRFFQKKNGALCAVCADPNRDTGELMIVAKDTDLEALEKSGDYHGRYFVLGGTMPLIEQKNGDKLRLKELTARVSRAVTPVSLSVIPAPRPSVASSEGGKAGIQSSHPRTSASSNPRASASPLKEIILALSANPDGEHTTDELRRILSPFGVKLTTLGRGLSTGSELEYADSETLKSALKNRSSG